MIAVLAGSLWNTQDEEPPEWEEETEWEEWEKDAGQTSEEISTEQQDREESMEEIAQRLEKKRNWLK
jgi:hypothetical protein